MGDKYFDQSEDRIGSENFAAVQTKISRENR